ncbi:MAG: PBP1A family penicillin-binding protein, partial [Chloroflexi bacterium]|nr:PBP1A family penicillin-binding protein [Chloroflexota bacterium]
MNDDTDRYSLIDFKQFRIEEPSIPSFLYEQRSRRRGKRPSSFWTRFFSTKPSGSKSGQRKASSPRTAAPKEELDALRRVSQRRRARPGQQRKPGNQRRRKGASGGGIIRKALVIAVVLLIFLVLAGAGSAFAVYTYYSRDLPRIDRLGGNTFETTKIYDRKGNLLYEVYDAKEGKRTYVTLQEISPSVIAATIATEDANFYSNSGVDPRAVLRAAYIELAGKGSSGASTITQQLVRNVVLTNEKYERTFSRKIREAILAMEFSRTYSKDKILEMYLNEVYYGNQSYGIDAAAQSYFGKLAKDLDLAESSMLAGLPQAPTTYDPTKNLPVAKERQKIVLGLMVKQGYITAEQAVQAEAEELRFVEQTTDIRAPHFVMYVKEVLEQKYGPEVVNRGGLSVFTSIDLDFQAAAEEIVRDQVEQLQDYNAHNGALVAMKPETGEILAMVGSADYNDKDIDGQVNMATWERQPGSAFKPITFLTAFKKGWSPATVVSDVKTEFSTGDGSKPYAPQNYDRKFHGPVSLRVALANSLNIPAVKALQYAGLEDTVDMAHALGITGLQKSLDNYGLSLTLGGGEVKLLDLTTAYGTVANEGRFTGPVSILKVVDKDGRVIDEYNPEGKGGEEVVSPQLAYLVTNVLSDNKAREMMFGPDNPLKLDRPAAVKTGTTEDWKDNLTVGYTPSLVVGVWVGNSNNEEMEHISGITGAAPIWHDFMERVYGDSNLAAELKGTDGQDLPAEFTQPDGFVQANVCPDSGLLPSPNCPRVVKEIFLKGTVPSKQCDWHKTFKICKESGKLATEFCPKDQVEDRVYEVLPQEYDGWQSADKRPPTEKCDLHKAPGTTPITDTTKLTPVPAADFPGLWLIIT